MQQRPVPVPTHLPYRIRTAGRINRDAFHSTRGTHHDDVMLTAVAAGRGVYLHGGQRQILKAGMIGLVFPSKDTGILMADTEDPYDHFYCRFAGELGIATARRIASRHEAPFFACDQLAEVLRLMEQIRLLHDHLHETNSDQLTPAEGLLAYLLAWLESRIKPAARQLSATALQAYLADHLSEPTDLNRISAHFSVSKSHLCRVARRELGQTVLEAAEMIKMDWACVLLREVELPIKSVARRVGYKDPLYFSRVFRRRIGTSPREWRLMTATAPARG
jgi:AraC-like DNA-binding protein